jgi:hypothetical protein
MVFASIGGSRHRTHKGSAPETEYGSDDASKFGGEPGGVLPPNARVGSVFDRNLSSLMKPAN